MYEVLQRILAWIWRFLRSTWRGFFGAAPPPPSLPPPANPNEIIIDFSLEAAEEEEELSLFHLPYEVLEQITSQLSYQDLVALRWVSQAGQEYCLNVVTELRGQQATAENAAIFSRILLFESENKPPIFDSCFHSLTNLTELSVTDCFDLTDNALKNLEELRKVSIIGGSSITGLGFIRPDQIEELNLFRNDSFDGKMLRHFTSLKALNLSLQKTISDLSLVLVADSLEALDLSENTMVEGPALLMLANLKKLVLIENDCICDNDLQNLALEELNLRSNRKISGNCLENSIYTMKYLNLRNNSTFSNSNLENFDILEKLNLINNKRIDREWFQTYTNVEII
jgi:hypothetical protein